MIFSGLCPPALIYLIYSVVQIGIDIIKGFYNTAFVKVWVAFVFTILLNYLCQSGLGIVSMDYYIFTICFNGSYSISFIIYFWTRCKNW